MATKRKSISKTVRFEVFKRDLFKCQYCGAHPPGVLLHIDHILAVASGGTNVIDNLVTACLPCNLGKGVRGLSVIPQSLSDKASETAEREAQLSGFQEIFEAKRERLEDETWRVLRVIHGDVDTVRRDEHASTKRFIEKLGLHDVLDAAEAAMAARGVWTSRRFRYFCGVCWSKVREAGQ